MKIFAQSVRKIAALLAICSASLFAADANPNRPLLDLQQGKPIANAWVLLTQYKTPILGGLFSSADPRRCVRMDVVKTDAQGRHPDSKLWVSAVLGAGIRGLSQPLSKPLGNGRFVLIDQVLQSSDDSERFGPMYDTEAQANQAREAFLKTAEGQNYTAYTVKPYGETKYGNYRMLVVKYLIRAQSLASYPSEAAADLAMKQHDYADRGVPDARAIVDVLGDCMDAKLVDAPRAKAFFAELQPLLVNLKLSDVDQMILRTWRERLR
jgi:hypothetical protein